MIHTITKTYSIRTDLFDRFIQVVKERGLSPSYVIRQLISKWLSGDVDID